jgi:hypothetical protein
MSDAVLLRAELIVLENEPQLPLAPDHGHHHRRHRAEGGGAASGLTNMLRNDVSAIALITAAGAGERRLGETDCVLAGDAWSKPRIPDQKIESGRPAALFLILSEGVAGWPRPITHACVSHNDVGIGVSNSVR